MAPLEEEGQRSCVARNGTPRDGRFDKIKHPFGAIEEGIFRISQKAYLPGTDLSKLSQELGTWCVDFLRETLKLGRCALLTPMFSAPDAWFYFASAGFPEEVEESRNYYTRGHGLTGEVLARTNCCDPVVSTDVENDPRWSRIDKVLIRRDIDVGPMGFLGLPIFVHETIEPMLPFAALVCCRFAEPNQQNIFTETEEIFLQHTATLLGHAFDVFGNLIRFNKHHAAQMELCEILQTPPISVDRLTQCVASLFKEGTFKRLLLALITPDGKRIKGHAVGGFQKDLLADTDRLLFTNSASSPVEGEDILSFVVRRHSDFPIEVDPHDEINPLTKSLNPYTTSRHVVTNRLLFLPIFGTGQSVRGVLMAELISAKRMASMIERKRLILHRQFIAACLETELFEQRYKRIVAGAEQMLSTANKNLDDLDDLNDNLRFHKRMLPLLTEMFGVTHAVSYEFDPETRLFRGMASIGLNERKIREITYSIEDVSLAVHAFRLDEIRYFEIANSIPLAKGDAEEAGFDPTWSVLSIPIGGGQQRCGIILLADSTFPSPSADKLSDARLLASIAAIQLQLLRLRRVIRQAEHIELSHQACLAHVAKLTRSVAGVATLEEMARECRSVFEMFLKEAVELLASEAGALFMPDQNVHVTGTKEGNYKFPQSAAKTPFLLRAAIGYPENLINNSDYSYSWSKKGLTSTVLRTLTTQHSADVHNDPRGSGRPVGGTFGEIRAWLGVPVIFQEGNDHRLYGILTFTRRRKHLRDNSFFQEREIQAAERLSQLLAMCLHPQQELVRAYNELKSRLRSFLHGVREPLDAAQRVRIPLIREAVELLDATASVEESHLLENDLQFVSAGFSAFRDFANPPKEWRDSRQVLRVKDYIAKLVFHVVETARSMVTVEPFVISFSEPIYSELDECRLIYILHALVHNAVKACKERGSGYRGAVSTVIGCEGGNLHFSVKDDGIGIALNSFERMFEEGYSGFENPSSGLGLAIVREFVNRYGGTIVARNREDGRGAIFDVVMPLMLTR